MKRTDENPYVYFVISDLQIKEDTDIAQSIGRNFYIGNVFTGNSGKRFSKIVTKDHLQAMDKHYPDTTIVAKGYLKNFKYTEPGMQWY